MRERGGHARRHVPPVETACPQAVKESRRRVGATTPPLIMGRDRARPSANRRLKPPFPVKVRVLQNQKYAPLLALPSTPCFG
jgi:hypothetical protein